MRRLCCTISLLILATAAQAAPLYLDSKMVPPGERTEAMGQAFPHIAIDGVNLDYDARRKQYVFHNVAPCGPFAGEKIPALWLEFSIDGKAKRLLGDVMKIDERTGWQYLRHTDGHFTSTGQRYHMNPHRDPMVGTGWEPDVQTVDGIAMHWDYRRKSYFEDKTREPTEVVWAQSPGQEEGVKQQTVLRTEKARRLNPIKGDSDQPNHDAIPVRGT